jgi:nitroreductase/ketosteroid isomerase-like protein
MKVFHAPAKKGIKGCRGTVIMDLKETFEKYVQSVQQADLDGLFNTVDNEEVVFLTASGNIIDSREGYYEFHKEWFSQSGWEMPVELVRVYEGTDFGYTVALFHFRQETPDGVYNLDSYFTLIFKKENGEWRVIADICTPIVRTVTEGDTVLTSEQYYLFDTIKTRRTVRRFKDDAVPEEHILKMLDAARYAPTARNKQPWKFLVIRERKKLASLKEKVIQWYMEQHAVEEPGKIRDDLKHALADMVEGELSAPVCVVVLVDSHVAVPQYIIHDGVLAAGHLMIAAKALGYGTGLFTTLFPEEKMKDFLNIPDKYTFICVIPVGVPEGEPEVEKKDLKEFVVFESFE